MSPAQASHTPCNFGPVFALLAEISAKRFTADDCAGKFAAWESPAPLPLTAGARALARLRSASLKLTARLISINVLDPGASIVAVTSSLKKTAVKYPDPEQLAEYRRALAVRRITLATEIKAKLADASSERVAPDSVTTTDGGDKALLDLASELDLAEVKRDVDELKEVEAAQERLAAGTYGQCLDCGERIAPERLRVQPAAKRCTACQQEHERRFRGTSGSSL